MTSGKSMRKGIFYSMDAAFALAIMIGAILLFSMMPASKPYINPLSTRSDDFIHSLSTIKIADADYDIIKEMIANGSIDDRQKEDSILGYVSELWAENETARANMILENISYGLFNNSEIFISINGEEILNESDIGYDNMAAASASRTVTGITKNTVIKGISARSYLTGIGNKITSDFIYFGGFEGQGNITKIGDALPADAQVLGMTLEFYTGANTTLYINGNLCEDIEYEDTELESSIYDLSHCINLLNIGSNNSFEFVFPGDIGYAYIGGGFIEIEYKTKTMQQSDNGSSEYLFPAIDGIINIYSSIPMPGDLKSMDVRLHYNVKHEDINNATFYLTLGNTTVYSIKNSTGENSVTLDNSTLSSMLNYTKLSNDTVPVRLGFDGLGYTIITEGNADVVLITDLSGSMKKATDSWGNGNSAPTCATFMNNPDTRRTRAAVCLDLHFVDIVMNASGNRVWPVYMKGDQVTYFNDPTNKTAIMDNIQSYYNDQGAGKTCIACVINQAYDILNTYGNASRPKFIIVMTDGVPTTCADGIMVTPCTGTFPVFGVQKCDGMCDTSGGCGSSDIGAQCTACTVNNGSIFNTFFSATRARNNINATIHTIGFGPIEDCAAANSTLHTVAQIGNGNYTHSKNVSELLNIYTTLAKQIISATIVSQTVIIGGSVGGGGGENPINTELYGDSYIRYTYESNFVQPPLGSIDVNLASDQLGASCDGVDPVELPDYPISEAVLTSYSGLHWTDMVKSNGNTVFNLSAYSINYSGLGDPFVVNVPIDTLYEGDLNYFARNIGDTPTNSSGCSPDSRLVYTISIPTSLTSGGIYPIAEGCTWHVLYDDLTSSDVKVPPDYAGTNECSYTPTNVSYNHDDAIDVTAYEFLSVLDIDKDNAVDISIDQNEFEINTMIIEDVPGLFGPSRFMVKVSK